MILKRGEIWIADLEPTFGYEQAGVRPVLIIQNNLVTRYSKTVLAIPITTNLQRSRHPSSISVASGDGGLQADSVLLCHQMRALDATRIRFRIGELDETTIRRVESAVLFSVGIR